MTEIYALDLDEDLLSHLPNPDAWVVLNGERLNPALIEDEFVRQVFEWQRQHIRQHGRVATAAVLEDEFDLELSEPQAAIGDLVERLRERYAKTKQRDALREVGETQKENPRAVPKLLIQKGRELTDLLVPKGEIYGTGDADRALRKYDQKVLAGPGASFGYPELDEYFYGMKGLNFMIAPPKTYKSWQIVQGAMINALHGRTVWMETLELPAEEADMRLRFALAGIPWWKYLHNKLDRANYKMIKETGEYIDSTGQYYIHKSPAGERHIDEIVYRARDAGADVIYVDQLQYLEGSNNISLGGHNKTGEYWTVLNRARDLSDEGPIMIAHQFSRSTMFCDSMPSMEQIKGSSAVEETATLALGMWAAKDMRKSGILQIGVLCARNYQYAAWEMAVELSRTTQFDITGRVPDEEA